MCAARNDPGDAAVKPALPPGDLHAQHLRKKHDRQNPEKWRRSEWKRAAGGEVQNRELWKLFLEEAEKHEIEMRLKGDEYTETLRAVIDGEEVEA